MRKIAHFFYHLFAPHEGNNFRARSLHHDFLTFYLLIAVSFLLLTRLNIRMGDVLGFATDINIQKLYEATNLERQKSGLSPVTLNAQLSRGAEEKAKDMFAKGYWAHYAPDGATPWDFFKKAGYEYEYAGENLAKNFLVSPQVVEAWMDSPSHRDNLLRPEYTDVGFAVVNGTLEGEETTLVVQFFGAPSGAPAIAEATPSTQELSGTSTSQQTQGVQLTTNKDKGFMAGSMSYSLTFALVSFLLLTVIIDLYVAARLNVFRIHGKNVAHFLFLAFFMIGLIFFLREGVIL